MRPATAHERRISRRLEARGLSGLGAALCKLTGARFGGCYEIDSLFAAGAEGAVFLARKDGDGGAPRYVAKIPLLMYHKPITLDTEGIRRRRSALREEGRHLVESASPYMPKGFGVYDLVNPLLDPARGGAFAEPEPVLVMERLPGFDLDMWLARMHGSDVDVKLLRRTLDAVAVAVLQGLWDLQERGFYYADLRPGNVRIGGRDRRARLLDAGSMVLRNDCSGKFPHVPAYLPPDVFERVRQNVERPFPTAAVQAVMAGRTLYEVATGLMPMPGQQVDLKALWESRVSQPVADTIDGLCSGSFSDVRQALKYLNKHAAKRVPSRLVPVGAGVTSGPSAPAVAFVPSAADLLPTHSLELAEVQPAAATPAPPMFMFDEPPAAPRPAPQLVPRKLDAALAAATAASRHGDDQILPPSKKKVKSFWRRFLDGLLGE